MPKISHPLSESERILFHANYKYMWDKISTTYFAVLRSKTPPSAKIDEKKLPSYAICAKCNNDESYAPSSLDELDRSVLRAIIEMYGGGPVGLETLAAALGEESVTLEDICEPYLMQMGMLTRTPRGRCVTRLAYEHLHMAVPKRFDDEDSGQTSMF